MQCAINCCLAWRLENHLHSHWASSLRLRRRRKCGAATSRKVECSGPVGHSSAQKATPWRAAGTHTRVRIIRWPSRASSNSTNTSVLDDPTVSGLGSSGGSAAAPIKTPASVRSQPQPTRIAPSTRCAAQQRRAAADPPGLQRPRNQAGCHVARVSASRGAGGYNAPCEVQICSGTKLHYQ